MSDKKTKAELHAMLAEAVRNTQPQPQPEPVGDTQPEPKRKMRPATKRPAEFAANLKEGCCAPSSEPSRDRVPRSCRFYG